MSSNKSLTLFVTDSELKKEVVISLIGQHGNVCDYIFIKRDGVLEYERKYPYASRYKSSKYEDYVKGIFDHRQYDESIFKNLCSSATKHIQDIEITS